MDAACDGAGVLVAVGVGAVVSVVGCGVLMSCFCF